MEIPNFQAEQFRRSVEDMLSNQQLTLAFFQEKYPEGITASNCDEFMLHRCTVDFMTATVEAMYALLRSVKATSE